MRQPKITRLALPRRAPAGFSRLVSSALAVWGLALTSCEATEVPVLATGEGSGSACMIGVMYMVAGDQFTFQGGQLMQIGRGSPAAASAGGNGAVAYFNLDGYDGQAHFYFDGMLIHRFAIDRKFILSSETEVLAYQDPGGGLYEYHLYVTTKCALPTDRGVQTRSEVEALES